jgi:hypothetical protein
MEAAMPFSTNTVPAAGSARSFIGVTKAANTRLSAGGGFAPRAARAAPAIEAAPADRHEDPVKIANASRPPIDCFQHFGSAAAEYDQRKALAPGRHACAWDVVQISAPNAW